MARRAEVESWQQLQNPPMRLEGVSVTIVLGARESRVHGEGSHPERWVRRHSARCEGLGIQADACRALRAVNPLRGPPCAVKAACTVTTGGMGKHGAAVRPVPTHWREGRTWMF
jgi:hypothetical protein